MRASRVVAGALAVFLFTEVLLLLAPRLRGPLAFDVGPSTGVYGAGFESSEERPPSTFRWMKGQAGLDLPLRIEGEGATLVFRAARFVDHPTKVRFSVAGAPGGTILARPGGFRVYSLALPPLDGPARIELLGEDPELGVALDWLRVEGARVRVPFVVWPVRLLAPGAFLLMAAAGLGVGAAFACAAGVSLFLGAAAALDPFALAHAGTRVAVPALLLAAFALWLLRRRPGRALVVMAFLAAYLLKAATLFHPAYFYNDVRNNFRYVVALRDDGRSLIERNHEAKLEIGVAYPRIIAGRKYAFPYAPVFFLPFGWLPDERVVEGIKHVAVAVAAAEVVVVYALAGLVFGPAAGAAAALLAAVLPPLHSRLCLAMWSTATGHFLDSLVVLGLLALAARGESGRRWAAVFAAVFAALLAYVASLFNLALLLFFAAVLVPRWWRRLAAIGLVSLGFVLVFLYRDFVWTFFTDIVPALLAGGGGAGETAVRGGRPGLLENVTLNFGRLPLFYGYGHLLLAVAGALLARRRAPPLVQRALGAAVLTFVMLVALRAFSFGLFKDLKEVEFGGPLVALFAGAAVEELAGRGPRGRLAAALLLAGLLAFSLGADWAYFAEYTFLAGVR